MPESKKGWRVGGGGAVPLALVIIGLCPRTPQTRELPHWNSTPHAPATALPQPRGALTEPPAVIPGAGGIWQRGGAGLGQSREKEGQTAARAALSPRLEKAELVAHQEADEK